MQVIILAAGYAKRLYPLTRNFPKPLLEIEKNKPVLNYIIEKLENINITKDHIVTNNKYHKHFLNWKNNLNSNLDIELINDNTNSDEDKLGAIGDLFFVLKQKNISEPLLLLNGDNLFDFELDKIKNYFNEKDIDTISISEEESLERVKNLGMVEVDNNNKIINLIEKPQNPTSKLHSNGIYFFKQETIELIKQYVKQGENIDRPGDLIAWLHKRKEIHGFNSKGRIIDIGTLETLEKAREDFKQKPL